MDGEVVNKKVTRGSKDCKIFHHLLDHDEELVIVPFWTVGIQILILKDHVCFEADQGN